ncbi:MAG: right-handed parallel beta-helix repeat-containing protein [Bacteroidota bacterium]
MRTLLGLGLLLLGGCQREALAPVSAAAEASVAASCSAGHVWVDSDCVLAEEAYTGEGGRVFVVDARHARASDVGPGTAERPWATVSRAAEPGALRPGDAVLIREGIYRESVRPATGGIGPDARITYAAYPGETVVISGADVALTGWSRQPDRAWRRAWEGPPLPTYSDDPVFRRELVIADGAVLQPVARRADLVPGSFWVEGPDTGAVAIYARFEDDLDPQDVGLIEIATRRRLFDPVGDDPYSDCSDPTAPGWLRIVGLTLRHAANRAQWGALCAGSEGGLVEGVRVEWTIGMGVDGSGRNHVFRNVRSEYNGQAGWGASCTSCLFEESAAVGNNWRGHDLFWEAGGGKWHRTRDTIIRRFTAADNNGPGIWLDGQNTRNTIEDCLVVNNEGAGIMLELATTETLVQNNLVQGTRWRDWTGTGILSQAASRNVLLHNTVSGNEGSGIWIRLDPLRRAPDGENEIVNNWVVGNVALASAEAREISIEGETLDAMRSSHVDGNAYGMPGGDPVLRSTFFAAPAPGAETYRGNDLQMWQRVVQDEANGHLVSTRGPQATRPQASSRQAAKNAGASGSSRRALQRVGASPDRPRGYEGKGDAHRVDAVH